MPRPVLLVDQQVAEVGIATRRLAGPVGVQAQRDLLGHHAAGEKGRRLDAEQLGDLGLEPSTGPRSP